MLWLANKPNDHFFQISCALFISPEKKIKRAEFIRSDVTQHIH